MLSAAELAGVEHRDTDAVKEYLAALAAMPEGPAEGMLYPTQFGLNWLNLTEIFRMMLPSAQQTASQHFYPSTG